MMEHRDFRLVTNTPSLDLTVHDMSPARREQIRERCLSELRTQQGARLSLALRPFWNAGLTPATLALGALYLVGACWNALALFR
ncbi:MAG: hypothetical protein P8020_15625 [Acidobacteriota bacterium]